MLTEFQLVFFLIGNVFVQGTYYVFQNATSWDAERENCTLAIPNLWSSSEGLFPKPDDNIANLVTTTGGKLWIGYYQAFVRFQYIGCVEITDATLDRIERAFSVLTIGDCYWACNYSAYIAVTKGSSEHSINCTCLEGVTELTQMMNSTMCTFVCKENDNNDKRVFACGSEDGRAFSIYRAKGETNGGKRCLYINTNRELRWDDCDTNHSLLCSQNIGGDFPVFIDSSVEENTWSNMQHACFEEGMYPASEVAATNSTALEENTSYWIGIIRSRVGFKHSGGLTVKSHRFAYLTSTVDGVVVGFQKNKYLSAICETVDSEISSTTTSTSETFSEMSSAYTTSTLEAFPETSLAFTTSTSTWSTTWFTTSGEHGTSDRSTFPDPPHTNATQNGNESSTATVAIASSTTGVVVFAVVVILTILWKRGTLPFSRRKARSDEDKRPAQQSYQNNSYVDGEELSIVTTNHNYFVLEQVDATTNGGSHLPTARTNNVMGQPDEEHQYATVDDNINAENVLDTTTTDYSMITSENVYNKLALEDESQYDHTVQRAPFATDNVYNTLAHGENYQYIMSNLTAAKGSEKVLESEYDTTNGVHK